MRWGRDETFLFTEHVYLARPTEFVISFPRELEQGPRAHFPSNIFRGGVVHKRDGI